MPSIDQWKTTWTGLGLSISAALVRDYEELIARYSESHRKYHTVRHLDECFAKLAEVRSCAEHPAEVEVALWFHDAIYEPRSNENEAKSAELASSKIQIAGGSLECVKRISTLIMATQHAAVPQSDDAKVLLMSTSPFLVNRLKDSMNTKVRYEESIPGYRSSFLRENGRESSENFWPVQRYSTQRYSGNAMKAGRAITSNAPSATRRRPRI